MKCSNRWAFWAPWQGIVGRLRHCFLGAMARHCGELRHCFFAQSSLFSLFTLPDSGCNIICMAILKSSVLTSSLAIISFMIGFVCLLMSLFKLVFGKWIWLHQAGFSIFNIIESLTEITDRAGVCKWTTPWQLAHKGATFLIALSRLNSTSPS